MALNQDQQYYSTTGNYYTPIYYNTDYYNQNLNNKHHGFYENNHVYSNQGLYGNNVFYQTNNYAIRNNSAYPSYNNVNSSIVANNSNDANNSSDPNNSIDTNNYSPQSYSESSPIASLEAFATPSPPLPKSKIPIRTNTVYRRVYSSRQTLILENEFKLNPFLTKSMKAELAHVLNLEEKQIKIWYQNQRAKQRRDFKNFRSESNSSS